MLSTDIRKIWTEFWETKASAERVHARASPASLIVNNADDPTTMFNTAGMQPLVPYLMGKEHPTGSKRVYNIQWCVRTIDIDEVGDRTHLTYFEMMGNWSLWDYFKKESIAWSWEFLTKQLKLDPEMLSVTVFEGDKDAPKDEESATLWKEQGVEDHRITYLGKSYNRWGPAWATWPCGPDTEIFYWIGDSEKPPVDSNPGNDDDNWLEIRNNVFMAYYKDDKGEFTELAAKNVDTGMWFERITTVVQHANWVLNVPLKEASIYDTDVFQGMIALLESIKTIEAKRIIADHMRTSLQLVQEWLVPSNEGRGYVLRRIIRRMYFQWFKNGGTWSFDWLISQSKDFFNTKYDGKFTNQTQSIIADETKQFAKTIKNGQKMVEELISEKNEWFVLSWPDAFKLYDTYWFPLELTQEIVNDHAWTVDLDWYATALKDAQDRSRQWGQKKFDKGTDWAAVIDWVPLTEFVGYDDLEAEGCAVLKDVEVEGRRVVIFDKTPFYAEWWGQKGDYGTWETDSGEVLKIVDVQKYGDVWLHFVEA